MRLSSTLSWLVDAASETPGADRFLAKLGALLIDDGAPLVGGALTLALPHPLIARRTWLWRAGSGEVIEALAFLGFAGAEPANSPSEAGRRWLAGLAAGTVHEDTVGPRSDGPALGWIGPRPFTPDEADRLREAARFATAPLATLTARATLTAALEAYLGRRSAARVMAAPLRRDIGEIIEAALLYADLRGFTALSESHAPSAVIAALDAWFDRIAGSVHAFGGEVLKFIGDGLLAIFPVAGGSRRDACAAALRAVTAARAGMARLDEARRQQGLAPLPFGVALHLGEMLWGNIGAADRLDFTAIGPAVDTARRLRAMAARKGTRVLLSVDVLEHAGARPAVLQGLSIHKMPGAASPRMAALRSLAPLHAAFDE